jgi:hypothetical protein
MGGRVAWRDNVFVQRLCRTIKYAEVCLKASAGARCGPSNLCP